jgi:hypothetical protein
MRAAENPAFYNLVVLGYEIFRLYIVVWKTLPSREPEAIGPLLICLLAPDLGIGMLVIDAVIREQLIEHLDVALQPELIEDPAYDCLVLIERHVSLLPGSVGD